MQPLVLNFHFVFCVGIGQCSSALCLSYFSHLMLLHRLFSFFPFQYWISLVYSADRKGNKTIYNPPLSPVCEQQQVQQSGNPVLCPQFAGSQSSQCRLTQLCQVWISVFLFSIYLFVCPSVYLYVYPSIYLLSVHPSILMSVRSSFKYYFHNTMLIAIQKLSSVILLDIKRCFEYLWLPLMCF